jgi:hypothetical protein
LVSQSVEDESLIKDSSDFSDPANESFELQFKDSFANRSRESWDPAPNRPAPAAPAQTLVSGPAPEEWRQTMATRPRRIAARPDPSQWGDDELLTFVEAANLLWPQGPLTASSLRTAYRAGELEVTLIARKLLTTKKALREMTQGARRKVKC